MLASKRAWVFSCVLSCLWIYVIFLFFYLSGSLYLGMQSPWFMWQLAQRRYLIRTYADRTCTLLAEGYYQRFASVMFNACCIFLEVLVHSRATGACLVSAG